MDEVDIFIEALRENHDRAQAKNRLRYEKLILDWANKSKKNEPPNINTKDASL